MGLHCTNSRFTDINAPLIAIIVLCRFLDSLYHLCSLVLVILPPRVLVLFSLFKILVCYYRLSMPASTDGLSEHLNLNMSHIFVPKSFLLWSWCIDQCDPFLAWSSISYKVPSVVVKMISHLHNFLWWIELNEELLLLVCSNICGIVTMDIIMQG